MHHPPSEFRTVLEEKLAGWNLPAELAAEIEEHSTPVTFEKGAIVFLHGASADFVFWLRKGFVKLYLPHAHGNRTLITIARPGEPLGTVANVHADGRNHQIFEAQALTKCSLGLFSREHMTSLLRKLAHERVVQLVCKLNATWSALFERYAGFIGLSFRERLELVFKDLGDRFGVEDRRGILITLGLSQQDLAEMIGSSRPMVSKVVGDMIDEGLLARSEQQRFILLRQTERQSKLASSSGVTRSAGGNRSPQGSRADGRSFIDSGRPAPLSMKRSSDHHI